METLTQRLAGAARDQATAMEHYNSPMESIRRKNLKGSEAKFAEGRTEFHSQNMAQTMQENSAMSKMNDPSKGKSTLATTMHPVKGKKY